MQLTRDNYFSKEADWHYMSVSQYKNFNKCAAMAMAKLKGEYVQEQSTALLQGSFMDAWNNRELAEFKQTHPEIYSSRGKTAGELKSEFKNLGDCIETLETDPMIMKALAGEKQTIFTAELFGTPWKIAIDSYNPKMKSFTDLKCVKSLYDRYFIEEYKRYGSFIEQYGYDTQMAVYREIEKLANSREDYLFPHIVAVTKEAPPDKAIISFAKVDGFDPLLEALEKVEFNMPWILEVKQGKQEPKKCGKCEYCRSVKKVDRVIHFTELLG